MKTIHLFILFFFTSTYCLKGQQIEVLDNTTGSPAIRTSGSGYNNSIEIDNNSQSWRMTSWTDNDFLVVKTSGTTFTPFRIQDDSFSDALRLGSVGVGVGESNPAARLHVTATSPDVLNLESNSQTSLNFYTGSTLQYQIRKLGSSSASDFQFRNPSSTGTTVWVQGALGRMTLSSAGYLYLNDGGGNASSRLHVNGGSDSNLYEFTIEDGDFAFMEFDAAVQSGIAFRNGSSTNANAWYRGNGNAGLILNTSSTGGTPHFFIEDNTGNVGIGDDTPDAIFDVEGDDDGCNFGSRTGSAWGYVNTQRPTGSSNTVVQRWRDGSATQATINLDGDTYQFTVLGSAFASGGTWTNSDAKLKENINALSEGTLDKVMRLKPSSYTFKNVEEYEFLRLPETQQIGFIAQELEMEFPQVVNTTIQTNADKEIPVEHELKSVNYEALVPVLTKAIQEQQELILTQQSLIEALEARVTQLEK